MSTQTVTVPDTVPPEWLTEPDDGEGGGDLAHRTCCDPEVALCGEPFDEAVEVAEGEYEMCAICERIDELDLPCGTRFCRARRWLRDWRKP